MSLELGPVTFHGGIVLGSIGNIEHRPDVQLPPEWLNFFGFMDRSLVQEEMHYFFIATSSSNILNKVSKCLPRETVLSDMVG